MRVRALLGAAFGALIATQVWAIEEGIDYTELGKPQATETGEKIEVLEVFMYGCPHCFELEPRLEDWIAKRPAVVDIVRIPAMFQRPEVQKKLYTDEEIQVINDTVPWTRIMEERETDYRGEPQGICSVSNNVTEARRLQRELVHSEKHAAVGKLAEFRI